MKDYRSLEQKIRDFYIAEAQVRNSKLRDKITNVSRQGDPAPTEDGEKLTKQGQIKNKIIEDSDEVVDMKKPVAKKDNQKQANSQDNDDPKQVKGGAPTQIDMTPTTNDSPEDANVEDAASKKARNKVNKEIGAKKTVKEDAGYKPKQTAFQGTHGYAADAHFKQQSPKMQDVINFHLRKGKDYAGAVAASKKTVKEETIMNNDFGLPQGLINTVMETLKGGQKKLDANKNGKIDAEDFKLLKSKKKVEEEVDEDGKQDPLKARERLTSHIKKDEYGKRTAHKHLKSMLKNSKGKHTNPNLPEEVESIDEISKSTVGSYINKASTDVHNKGFQAGKASGKADWNTMGDKTVKSIVRQVNIGKAVDKLTGKSKVAATEEVDFSEEEVARIEAIAKDVL